MDYNNLVYNKNDANISRNNSSIWYNIKKNIDLFFCISARGSTISTEIWAGFILFSAISYIIIVNPDILKITGISKTHTANATILAAMISTLMFSLVGNLPIAAAPGMGLNTLFAYEVVKQRNLTPNEALGCSFLSGILLLIFASSGLCELIIKFIPFSLKKSVVVGLGLFQTIISLSSLEIIKHGEYTILQGTSIDTAPKIIGIITLIIIIVLLNVDCPGAILIGIISGVCLALIYDITSKPISFFNIPNIHIITCNFEILKTSNGAISSLFILLVLFIDTGGVLLGFAGISPKQLLDKNGNLIYAYRAYIILGISVIISSLLGTSPVIIFLESAAAIRQGGRTGLTSLVTSILCGISIFFINIIDIVPSCATCPVLILIGLFMMSSINDIEWNNINKSFPAYITLTMICFSCSITYGFLCGLFFYIILNIPIYIIKVLGQEWIIKKINNIYNENHKQNIYSI